MRSDLLGLASDVLSVLDTLSGHYRAGTGHSHVVGSIDGVREDVALKAMRELNRALADAQRESRACAVHSSLALALVVRAGAATSGEDVSGAVLATTACTRHLHPY